VTVAHATVPPGFVEIGAWPLHGLGDLATLREGLHRMLTGGPLPADRALEATPERVVLVASELATNALRHGLPPTVVRLLSDGRELVVDVVDHSPEVPVVAGRRSPGAGGFGLVLAQRAATAVGWFRAGTGEKHVWARFDVPVFRAGASVRSALLPAG
jgi:hypothetical protein